MKRITLALTGASGMAYGLRLLECLLAAGCRVDLLVSQAARIVLGVRDPGFGYLLQQAGSGRVWVKLSAPYRIWPAADCAASGRQATAQLLQAFAAERLLWGSDWPHTTETPGTVNDADLVDLLQAWAASDAAMDRILVDNPARLYGFDTAAPA